jgi:hypothetical protein
VRKVELTACRHECVTRAVWRATAIVSDIRWSARGAKCDEALVEQCVLRAIYCVDAVTGEIREPDVAAVAQRSVSEHVRQGVFTVLWRQICDAVAAAIAREKRVKIVPTALLLASGRCSTVTECAKLLGTAPVRSLVRQALGEKAD